jgi:hypothetical protein
VVIRGGVAPPPLRDAVTISAMSRALAHLPSKRLLILDYRVFAYASAKIPKEDAQRLDDSALRVELARRAFVAGAVIPMSPTAH